MPEDYHETAAEEKLTTPPPPPAKPKEKSLGDQIWSDILGFGKRAGSYAKDRSKKATRKAYERRRATMRSGRRVRSTRNYVVESYWRSNDARRVPPPR
jgi:hypothetical protein